MHGDGVVECLGRDGIGGSSGMLLVGDNMLSSVHSPTDSNNDHLRLLLDQRATRADFHSRFSPVLPDSPSVYSLFSPRPSDGASPYHHQPRSNRDRFNDPSASMLDFDDESRSSCDSSDVYHTEQPTLDEGGDDDDDDDEPMPRMSLLGPKMRFHSRAPWETDEDSLQEQDEQDDTATYAPSTRGKDPLIRKGFGLRSGSPRPSGESSRSQSRSKGSFETTSSQMSNPRGALYTLAHESLSTSSLGPSPSSGQKTSRAKFSLGRVRSQSPKPSVSPSSGASRSNTLSPITSRPPHVPPSLRIHNENIPSGIHDADTNFRNHHLSSSSYSEEDIHPYAHPDLNITYAQELSPPPSTPQHARRDSTVTLTEAVTFDSLERSGQRSTEKLNPSEIYITPEHIHRNRSSTFQGKEISSPISVHGGILRPDQSANTQDDRQIKAVSLLQPPPGVNNLSGWTDRVASPAITLITLEEARAKQSRTVTANVAPSQNSAALSSVSPFSHSERETTSTLNNFDASPNGSVASRARARSISAGAKAKSALHTIVGVAPSKPERRDTEPLASQQQVINSIPGKTLKHKKSGFMKLFNGGREKEDRTPPPPVPPLSDAHVAYIARQKTHITPKLSAYRTPVSQWSLPLHDDTSSETSHSPQNNVSASLNFVPSQRPPPPSLSINTFPFEHLHHKFLAEVDFPGEADTRSLTMPDRSWLQSSHTPQSAPANVPEFHGLKLRPVSTMFSSQFRGHLVADDSQPSLDADLDTLASTSPKMVMSPITPGSVTRQDHSNSDKLSAVVVHEDQSPVIQALQDHIISAKSVWQRHIWELEGQIRDLKAEVTDLRAAESEKGYCDACGRGQHSLIKHNQRYADQDHDPKNASVVNRPRVRTGTGTSRFGSGVS